MGEAYYFCEVHLSNQMYAHYVSDNEPDERYRVLHKAQGIIPHKEQLTACHPMQYHKIVCRLQKNNMLPIAY